MVLPDVRFGYTIVYVPDVAAAIDFYERAFGVRRGEVVGEQYAELDTGETKLAFAAESLAEGNLAEGFRRNDPAEPPAAIELAFTTEDVGTAYQVAIDAGAAAVAGPAEKPWGQTVAYVRDLNGVLVEICTPIG